VIDFFFEIMRACVRACVCVLGIVSRVNFCATLTRASIDVSQFWPVIVPHQNTQEDVGGGLDFISRKQQVCDASLLQSMQWPLCEVPLRLLGGTTRFGTSFCAYTMICRLSCVSSLQG
jgi:hypothetical protein